MTDVQNLRASNYESQGLREVRVAVAICTYRRNEPLRTLLRALVMCAEHAKGVAVLGVVVVDDTTEGSARVITEEFVRSFDGGIHYRIAGRQNISLARNLAVQTALDLGDWVAMIDDDCEPLPNWLTDLLYVQRRTASDAVTGAMIRRVPAGSPKWLSKEPFLVLGACDYSDGQSMETAFTNNSVISSSWLRQNPAVRFNEKLGVIGGEDMEFFQAAYRAGLKISFSSQGFVYENEPLERTTLFYQLRRFFWHGNSTYVTLVAQGKTPFRVLVHGVANLFRAMSRPVLRGLRGQSPQVRYAAASMLSAIGTMIGIVGVRVKHR